MPQKKSRCLPSSAGRGGRLSFPIAVLAGLAGGHPCRNPDLLFACLSPGRGKDTTTTTITAGMVGGREWWPLGPASQWPWGALCASGTPFTAAFIRKTRSARPLADRPFATRIVVGAAHCVHPSGRGTSREGRGARGGMEWDGDDMDGVAGSAAGLHARLLTSNYPHRYWPAVDPLLLWNGRRPERAEKYELVWENRG
jgi:hypothetical protein